MLSDTFTTLERHVVFECPLIAELYKEMKWKKEKIREKQAKLRLIWKSLLLFLIYDFVLAKESVTDGNCHVNSCSTCLKFEL